MLKKLSSQSYKTTSLVVLLFAVLWFLPDFLSPNSPQSPVFITIFKTVDLFCLPTVWASLLQFFFILLTLFAGNRLVRKHQFLPIKPNIFLAVGGFLFVAIEPFHYFSSTSIALIFFYLSVPNFVAIVLDQNASQAAFSAIIFNLFGASFEPAVLPICLLILFVMGCYKMLSAKSFLACFWAFAFVLFLTISCFYLIDEMALFQQILNHFALYSWQPQKLQHLLLSLPYSNWMLIVMLLILFCMVLFSNLLLVQKIKTLTRFYYSLLVLLYLFSLVFACVFYESFASFLFASTLFLALQLALFFSYRQNLYEKILFYCFVFFCVAHRVLTLFSL